jgi:hypothetical protein
MKNPVTILLLSVQLFAYTDIVQVFKFPKLIEHYRTHHSINKSLGFIDFLIIHYCKSNDGNSKDDWDDMQLPFKTASIHILCNAIIFPVQTIIPVMLEETHHDFTTSYYNLIIPSTLKGSLFRPPIS